MDFEEDEDPPMSAVPASHGLKWDCPDLDEDPAGSEVPGSDPRWSRGIDSGALPSASIPSLVPGPLPRLYGQLVTLPCVGACCDLSVRVPPRGLPGGSLGLDPLPPAGSVVTGLTGLPGLLWHIPLLLLLLKMSFRKVGKGSFDGAVSIWLACLRAKPDIRHLSVRTNLKPNFLSPSLK